MDTAIYKMSTDARQSNDALPRDKAVGIRETDNPDPIGTNADRSEELLSSASSLAQSKQNMSNDNSANVDGRTGRIGFDECQDGRKRGEGTDLRSHARSHNETTLVDAMLVRR